jgi:hypothetical protein
MTETVAKTKINWDDFKGGFLWGFCIGMHFGIALVVVYLIESRP